MSTDELLQKLIDQNEADTYIFNGTINNINVDKFINMIREKVDLRENCALFLTTYGGYPDSGYRMIRTLKRYYTKLILYVLGPCKSTGTLMALGADEIIMGDFGEFGPLDIQLTKDDEMSNTSGLSYIQSLTSLSDQIYKSFELNFLNVKQRSGGAITTRTAAEIGTKLAIGLLAPISAHIDPVKLGEVQRAINIALKYGQRLCQDTDLVEHLIINYPSHGFVIDYDEAEGIFPNVRWVNDLEALVELNFSNMLVTPQNQQILADVDILIKRSKMKKDMATSDLASDNDKEPISEEGTVIEKEVSSDDVESKAAENEVSNDADNVGADQEESDINGSIDA